MRKVIRITELVKIEENQWEWIDSKEEILKQIEVGIVRERYIEYIDVGSKTYEYVPNPDSMSRREIIEQVVGLNHVEQFHNPLIDTIIPETPADTSEYIDEKAKETDIPEEHFQMDHLTLGELRTIIHKADRKWKKETKSKMEKFEDEDIKKYHKACNKISDQSTLSYLPRPYFSVLGEVMVERDIREQYGYMSIEKAEELESEMIERVNSE